MLRKQHYQTGPKYLNMAMFSNRNEDDGLPFCAWLWDRENEKTPWSVWFMFLKPVFCF